MSDCTTVIIKRKGRRQNFTMASFICQFRFRIGMVGKLPMFLVVFNALLVFLLCLDSSQCAKILPVGHFDNRQNNLVPSLKPSLVSVSNDSHAEQLQNKTPVVVHRHHRQIRHLQQQQRRHAIAKQQSDSELLLPQEYTMESSHEAFLEESNSERGKGRFWSSEEEFPQDYWVRIAQAKALALAVENGTLPRLDEYSEIMKPAGCRKDHDKDCVEFTTTCAEKVANDIIAQHLEHHVKPNSANVTYYMLTIFRQCGYQNFRSYNHHLDRASMQWQLQQPSTQVPQPHPVFHCNSHLGVHGVLTNFRMEYPGTNLPPKINSDLIPRYFVIETSTLGGKWKLSSKPVQAYWLFRFNFKHGLSYRIRVTAVSPKYVYPPVTSPEVRIYESKKLTVSTPTNLRVVNITVDGTAARPKPSALIRWNSGSGLNASCDFDVFYMEDDYTIVERKKGDDAFWVKLDNLHFRKNYTLKIIEKFGEGREKDITSHLYIPSCLEMRKFSFDLCPPPPPTSVRIVNATDDSFVIKWDAPLYSNETNRILHYNLTVDWIYTPTAPSVLPTGQLLPDSILHGSNSPIAPPSASTSPQALTPTRTHRIFSGSVNGNLTSIQITNVTQLRGQFKIQVSAIGAAGASPLSWNVLHYKGIETDSPISDWTLRKILTLVFALVGVVALVTLFCVLKHFHERRQRKKKRQQKFENYEKESLQLQEILCRDATKWEIECCNLDLKEGIGKGNFGLVRRAILNQRGKKMTVAVKTLRDGVNENDVDKLWEEYEILKNLDPHVHVVGLKGIVTKHVPFPLLVVEYCDGGDLQSHLRKIVEAMEFSSQRRYHAGSVLSSGSSANSSIVNLASSTPNVNNGGSATLGSTNASSTGNNAGARVVTNAAYFLRNEVELAEGPPKPQLPNLTIADLLSYSRQVACGMEYLSNNKIVHRDLAARNILISGKSRILKISDFGLSRDVYEQNWYKKSSKGEIPFKWLAIECILNEIYTTKSDVWSYGILLWEIFTYGGNPYPGVDNHSVFGMLKTGYRMERPNTCPVELYELMRLCWDDDPGKRPDFTGIRLMLEEIIEKTTHVTYLNLETGSSSGKSGSHCYKNTDSGFEEYDGSSLGCEPMLPPRNKKRVE